LTLYLFKSNLHSLAYIGGCSLIGSGFVHLAHQDWPKVAGAWVLAMVLLAVSGVKVSRIRSGGRP
jgi:hypothetical protein